MPYMLTPVPVLKFTASDGSPLAGGLLSTFIAGTSTPSATYADSIGTENTNPIVLDSNGECTIFVDPTVSYKFNLTDSDGAQIQNYPKDNINVGQEYLLSSAVNTVFNSFSSFQIADVKAGYLGYDVTGAIQDAIGKLHLNYANTGILSPRGFSNGGTIVLPAGMYKVTSPIVLKRGVRIVGQGRESTQIINYGTGSVFQYQDAGRDVQDEIVIKDLSIWQASTVTPTNGAAIDLFFGDASNQSIGVSIENCLIVGTYQGVRIGAAIWSTFKNVDVSACVSNGFHLQYTKEILGQNTQTTSTTFQNCYANQCAIGYYLEQANYCSLVSCACDSNSQYGYVVDGGICVTFTACGAERNATAGMHVKNGAQGTVINAYLLFATAGSPHGVILENTNNTTFIGGSISAIVASGGYGIHTVGSNGYITIIGTVFAGNFVGNEIDTTTEVFWPTPGGANGLLGRKDHLSFGSASTPTTSRWNVSGIADATTNMGALHDVTHTVANGMINAQTVSVFKSADTVQTYWLAVAHWAKNSVKGASATHACVAGYYAEEQTTGVTANANYFSAPAGSTITAGAWDWFSLSTRASYWKSGYFKFLSTTDGPIEKWGTGSPEGAVTAAVGSVFHRTDGGAGTCLYIKESGTGGTGWVGK